jgi:MFS transporter, FSR family, fosmidomycin resistance protein
MASTPLPATQNSETPARSDFQTEKALPILAGHLVHDTFTSAVAPLLPELIKTLSLNLTAAGVLPAVMQLPGLLNPLIGYLADRVSVRYFVILSPAVTATLVSLMGWAPGYWSLVLLLFAVGVSTACFHAPAPAMVARVSGRRVGLGMSLFMAAGEGAYTIGPLIFAWAVSAWTLEGIWRLMFFGWAASLMLFFTLQRVEARPEKVVGIREVLPAFGSLFLPIALFNLARNPLVEALTTYLPTYMSFKGADLWISSGSLSIVQVAGVAGALLVGAASDRIDRRRLLLAAQSLAALLALAFVFFGRGWLLIPLLLGLGLTVFAATPLMLVMVQEHFPNHRSTANGIYMMVTFVLRPLGTLAVGGLGDWLGLDTTLVIAALFSLLTLPVIIKMPWRPPAAA